MTATSVRKLATDIRPKQWSGEAATGNVVWSRSLPNDAKHRMNRVVFVSMALWLLCRSKTQLESFPLRTGKPKIAALEGHCSHSALVIGESSPRRFLKMNHRPKSGSSLMSRPAVLSSISAIDCQRLECRWALDRCHRCSYARSTSLGF